MKTYQEKYIKYKLKYLELKKNTFTKQNGGGNNKTLVLIKADWCGHCKAFKSTWEQLPANIPNVNFKILDSESNPDEIKKYNIKGYPTIILETGDKKIEYNGSRTVKDIKQFVENN